MSKRMWSLLSTGGIYTSITEYFLYDLIHSFCRNWSERRYSLTLVSTKNFLVTSRLKIK